MFSAAKSIFITLVLLLYLQSNGQVVRPSFYNRYAAVGAYSKNFSDIFSATSNQASLAGLKTAAFGVYGERRFMLEDLANYSSIVAVPAPSGTFGLQVDYLGSSFFNATQIGIIYARKVSAAVDVGVKFNYHTVRMAGYGNVSSLNFDLGAIFHLTEKLHSGIHIYNPSGSELGKTGSEKLESVYSFGLGYEASEKLFISAEIIKHEDRPVGVIAGLQYNLHTKVFIRTGISANNDNSYVGIGLNVGFARVDLNTAYHPQLGFTPGILLLMNFKKPAEE